MKIDKTYNVVSLHPYTDCNLDCPFCYKKKGQGKEKPEKFWFSLIPYIKKLTDQVAFGGGEPFMRMDFVKKFARECKKEGLIFNVTSNGKLLMPLEDKDLQDVLRDVTMVSLSFDYYKIKGLQDLADYLKLVERIKRLTSCQVGCNFLVNDVYFKDRDFEHIVDKLFLNGIDRVFALCPKNVKCPKILENKDRYFDLTRKYKMFFVDDLTKEILEQGYDNWKTPCHFCKDLVSINEDGFVTGCSFDDSSKAILKIVKPEDLLKIKNIYVKGRFLCPYLTK